MEVKLTKVHKGELLTVDNPKYQESIHIYDHLNGIKIEDKDSKAQLPVHIVLGSGNCARIKTETKPHFGRSSGIKKTGVASNVTFQTKTGCSSGRENSN